MYKINVGNWRNGPMQVVSGAMGRERVHFEAPNHKRMAKEMNAFLNWFGTFNQMDPVIKAAVAHFWFVTIHPFDDGNGRIARAITDMQLARADNSPQRFYSMSAQILRDRKGYYEQLERAQRGDLDITEWLKWFLDCLYKSMDQTEKVLEGVLQRR
jgi:Fic family protein